MVVGHGIQPFTAEWDAALVLYLVIYAFHMPAFAIISGYFSRSEPTSTRRMVAGCVGLALLLTGRPVRRLFRPFVEPKPGWLFRPEERDDLRVERERILEPHRQGR